MKRNARTNKRSKLIPSPTDPFGTADLGRRAVLGGSIRWTVIRNRSRWSQQFLPLVRGIACNVKRFFPSSVELNDLVQCGMLGLLQAATRYRGAPAQFQCFAVQRIRDAMLKGLPALEFAPCKLRRQVRGMLQRSCDLQQKLMRPPSAREVAAAMRMTLEDFECILRDLHRVVTIHVRSREQRLTSADDTDPPAVLQLRETINALVKALNDLPKREQLMLQLRYRDSVKLNAIGVMLGLSESRVCHLLKHSMARLRAQVSQ